MNWRRQSRRPSVVQAHASDGLPDAERLHAVLVQVRRSMNQAAGRLPVRCLVTALEIIDLLRQIVASAGVRPLEIQTVVWLERFLDDYLPTSVRSFLAIGDPAPAVAIGELQHQLDVMLDEAGERLAALRAMDTDAMRSHGAFLRTKFTRSDLDL